MAYLILATINHVYVSLHRDTDSALTRFAASTSNWTNPLSYPVCNVAGHIHDNSAPTTVTRAILYDNAALVPTIASPDSPSFRADAPPLENFHPAHPKIVEVLHTPATSPDAATTGTVQDIVTSGTTMPHSTLKSSISVPPLSPTSPPAAVALWQNAEPMAPSDPPNLPHSASSNPVLDSILPTGAPLIPSPGNSHRCSKRFSRTDLCI
ncbi:hypothetical protein EDB92DRAFT_1877521 [Lactarius akahatsu]|uniref:Uncharacterized protein n=1 Tax=Lactarius akahatsu TaxID=416441 RepID=A0AAD4LAU8_9AGAM|nr:hypothetical protein EDB92DRAFT_1877521 [Lactarius akahatsu]